VYAFTLTGGGGICRLGEWQPGGWLVSAGGRTAVHATFFLAIVSSSWPLVQSLQSDFFIASSAELTMQRNMDLVRTILMRIEDSPSRGAAEPFGILGFTPEQVDYHAHIMMEDGLIEGVGVTNFESKGPEAVPQALTWKGHEFLDLARDQKRWNQAKAAIGKLGSAPISVWTKVLHDLMLKELSVAP
jgi:hypothetical protein